MSAFTETQIQTIVSAIQSSSADAQDAKHADEIFRLQLLLAEKQADLLPREHRNAFLKLMRQEVTALLEGFSDLAEKMKVKREVTPSLLGRKPCIIAPGNQKIGRS